jgi:hypothetical protein
MARGEKVHLRTSAVTLVCALTLVAFSCRPAAAWGDERLWAVTLYGATLSGDTLGEMLTFQAELDSDYKLVALALTRKMKSVGSHIDLELEGSVAKHYKGMNHFELSALGSARWHTFPWDKWLTTSVAAGLGLSLATAEPEFEVDNHGESQKLLGYLLGELTFGLPRFPDWALVARIHHRSGASGSFGQGIRGASNSFGWGVKYRF